MDKYITSKSPRVRSETASTSMDRSNEVSKCPNDLGMLTTFPAQPQTGIQFPKNSSGRKFSPMWYARFPWLEYSVERDAAFCYACRHFVPDSSFNYDNFAVKGYNGWKRALGDKNKGLELHSHAASHIDAMSKWEERKRRTSSRSTVKELVSNNVYERRHYYVRAIAEVIYFLAVNELSFRGDYDKIAHSESGILPICLVLWHRGTNIYRI
ncbi:hypothetical protein SNE40_021137 [Patella caerulea]|uniref:TTF-type domain-containing protein n=1 Tax=Patella caerulea TaxID=87958 RepID=A0AAN8IX73_PATCE